MPQRISNIHPKPEVLFTTYGCREQPELAGLVMQTIEIWSRIDFTRTTLLAEFLKADFDVVHSMFNALTADSAKRSVIKAAGRAALKDDNEGQSFFLAVMKFCDSEQKTRHKFAHWIWTTSPDLPDALVLVKPTMLVQAHFELLDSVLTKPPGPLNIGPFEDIYIYTKIDLTGAISAAMDVLEVMTELPMALLDWRADGGARIARRRKLSTRPRLQSILQNQSTQNGPEGQPE